MKRTSPSPRAAGPNAGRSHPVGRGVDHVDGKIRAVHLIGLAVLLTAPGLALHELAHRFDSRLVFGWAAGINVFTYFLYGVDKGRARERHWRISEATLHLGELLGGWPGAFVAQQRFRHKSSKFTYQFVFWLIVVAHQYVAIGWLLGWRLAGFVPGLAADGK